MMPNLVGQTLGKYRILERLGQGKDAVVYRAQQLNLERTVALKVVPATNADGIERLRRESQLVAKLKHPGIREVISIEAAAVQGAPPGSPTYVFAVLEFAEQSLKALVDERQRAQRPFTLHETVAILRPIADVLDYLASLGIAHMDVKPENILLTATGRIMLSDFGVAQSFGQPMSHGTPAYVPPEVLEKGKQVVAATDVYSLGVVAFQMLSGDFPFKGDNPTALYYAHTHTVAPMLDRVNPACKNTAAWVISQALAKAPTARWVSAGAFLAALTRSDTFSVRLTTWPKRRPRAAFASAMGVVALAGAFAFSLPQLLPPPAPPPIAAETATMAPLVTTPTVESVQPTLAPAPTGTKKVVVPIDTPAAEAVSEPTVTPADTAAPASPTPVAATAASSPTPLRDEPQCTFGDAKQSVAIYAPRANVRLKRGPIPIRGVADFQEGGQVQVHYEVRVAPGDNCEAGQNTVIDRPARLRGELGTWDASSAPPGPYCLQLRAVLNDGNYKICNVPVSLE